MDTKIRVLLRDFGYRVDGNAMISVGIRGFMSDEIVGRCRSMFDAMEQLQPRINDPEFSARASAIRNPS